MGDRAPVPSIPGSLTGFVGQDGVPVAYFDAANRLTRVSLNVLEAPSGGTTVAQLNTAADGSGSGISVTIADGARFATATGDIAITAASYLYLIITSDAGGALGLSGDYEIERVSGVTTYLTTLAAVKLDETITGTDADRDAVLNAIIAGVSKRIQNEIDRPIVQTTATNEKVDSIGQDTLQTRHYPIISVSSLTEDDTALTEDTDFELNEEDKERGQIVRLANGFPTGWARGRRIVKLTYIHGYASVPDDLVRAATAQVLRDYYETKRSAKGWRGLAGKGINPSDSLVYDQDFWQRQTLPVLAPYRRMVA